MRTAEHTTNSRSYSFAVTEEIYTLTSYMSNSTDIRYYVNTTATLTIGEVEISQDINMVKKPTGTMSGSVMKRLRSTNKIELTNSTYFFTLKHI